MRSHIRYHIHTRTQARTRAREDPVFVLAQRTRAVSRVDRTHIEQIIIHRHRWRTRSTGGRSILTFARRVLSRALYLRALLPSPPPQPPSSSTVQHARALCAPRVSSRLVAVLGGKTPVHARARRRVARSRDLSSERASSVFLYVGRNATSSPFAVESRLVFVPSLREYNTHTSRAPTSFTPSRPSTCHIAQTIKLVASRSPKFRTKSRAASQHKSRSRNGLLFVANCAFGVNVCV